MEGEKRPIDLELLTTDEELVVNAQQGSADQREDAIQELVRRYYTVAFKSAVAILRNEDAARDVAQECMVKLLTRIHSLNAFLSVRSWIATVARHRAQDVRRAMRRIIQFGCDSANAEERKDDYTPFEHALYSDVMRQIDALPPKQRVVVERHLLDGESVADIAADLRLTPAAIYERLRLAKVELRRLLDPNS